MRGTTKVEKCFSRQELNDRAKLDMVDTTPLRFYLRTAELLFKQAKIYEQEGDLQASYILYMKFCNLVISELRKHGDYNNPTLKASISSLNKSAMVALNEVEALKPILDKKYADYQHHIKQREAAIKAEAQAHDAQLQLESRNQKDIERTIREQQDQYWAHHTPAHGWSLAKALEGVPGVSSTQLTPQHQHQHQHQHQYHQGSSGEIQYPEHHHREHDLVQYHQHRRSDVLTPTAREPQHISTPTGPPPALPRKPGSVSSNAPKLPPKIQIEEDVHEFSQGLRTLIVPVRLLDRFLNIVRPNTIKNLETCGILAGVLSHNKLTVTTLIIPKQTATSDTCSTTNEDELFEFQSERDLLTLGWIHTHPTQTCFMSSVDLHTHCSYQLMLPEAIAIVCAPKHDKE
ncbi:hypothetical protein BGZ99_002808 [Dissophora globulifera]|uniref:MPN domain-containing protein n=1 Tax=Dissophora globulifera TaxID=979702 RepID=A0A9P6V061_9FUNG|nr:hypothetical protein BGZ99_002808 [Dissophora globulifera]